MQVYNLIKDAMAGNLKEGPIITTETGRSKTMRNHARQNMVEVLLEIKPEELDNFKLLEPAETKLTRKLKKRQAKN